MKLAFLGLGNMGQPMARNLAAAKFDLIVWNRSPARADDVVKAGATAAPSVAEAARVDVALTMVADDAALEAIVFDGRLLETLPGGAIHVSMSTISVALAEKLAAAHAARGSAFVSAPVFGRPDAAAAGKLFIVAAGPSAALETCQPIFDALGQRTFRVGAEARLANLVKLSGNFLLASIIESLAEAFALVRKAGVDPHEYLELLTGTLFTAPLFRTYGTLMADRRYQPAGFPSPRDLGVNMYVYPPANQTSLSVTSGFSIETGTATQRTTYNRLFAVSDDLTLVKGSHQLGFGANVQRWRLDSNSTSRTGGVWTFDGSLTGLGLADLMMGRVARLEIGGPNVLLVHSLYMGAYGQDSWRLSSRVTANMGLRWEPYSGQDVENGAIMAFNRTNFDRGVRSTVYRNAPPGIIYPGDAGFPNGNTGLNKQWRNFAPRVGVAWDVHGDGRLAVRSSYSMGYDFEAGEYHNINAGSPPFGNRSIINDPAGLMDNPWSSLGGDPHPIVTGPNVAFIPYGAFGVMNADINSPRVQQWNVTVEQQLGSAWGVSASYLGSYSDRLWAQTALNPGVFLGLGPCVLNGVSYSVCSTTSNLDQRRVLSLQDPVKAAGIGALDLNSDVGWQKYRGLKLSGQHRSATGVSFNGSYTLSRCVGTPTTTAFNQISSGYTDPSNPDIDAGYCDQNRKHLGTANVGYQTPEFGHGVVHGLVSQWRVSGIFNARSGDPLNITSGKDNAFNGISAQRPDLVGGQDIYGPGKSTSDIDAGASIDNYLNRAAFAQPAAGALGNLPRNYAVGPAFWQVNLAVSKFVSLGTRRVELRLESFNLFNHFNWGDPQTNFNSSTFGKITTQAGDPRILQFGIKYDF